MMYIIAMRLQCQKVCANCEGVCFLLSRHGGYVTCYVSFGSTAIISQFGHPFAARNHLLGVE